MKDLVAPRAGGLFGSRLDPWAARGGDEAVDGERSGPRLVVVSNRVTPPSERSGRAGGLAVAMREALRKNGGVWFGWSGEATDRADPETKVITAGNITYATTDLNTTDHEQFYLGFSNRTLWPLFHYRAGLMHYSRPDFDGYMRVNQRMARSLAGLLRPDDLIWVHDYHFIPLGEELRRLGVRNRIGFFLHTPLPAPSLLTILPHHDQLVRALCAYDLVGLQTEDDLRALRSYVTDEAGGTAELVDQGDHALYNLTASGQTTQAGAFPIGIDTGTFARLARTAATAPDTVRLRDSLLGRKLIIGVDRLDYSKGLGQRFEAIGELLEQHPEHTGEITFMQIAPTSRGEVAEYQALRQELEGLAGRINGRFAEFDWAPVRYLNKSFTRNILAGFYRFASVGLVTPLRDGMNLVAKEFVAAQDADNPGVLVLSRFAGAARELDAALLVNPFDGEEMASALHRALSMPVAERRERQAAMMEVLRRNTVTHWWDSFTTALAGPSAAPDYAPLRTAAA